MNKKQIEVEKTKLSAEEEELKYLKGIYHKASDEVAHKIAIHNGTINVLLANYDDLSEEEKSILQSKIYQKNFQKSLQKQLDGFLADLDSGQYKSIEEYLNTCYENGFIGTMYDLHGQGIPIVSPIDQKNVVKAIHVDSKISKPLYTKLGEDVGLLKDRIRSTISRGIATSSSFSTMARNIAADSNVGFNRAMRIARTEGHRIQTSAALDAQHEAKKKGADVVKQWDSTLDGKTRDTHRKLDGQIRELDDDFEIAGMKTSAPGHFGDPAEDVNCRCAILQRARWALGEDELEILKQRAAYFGLDKTDSFEDFKQKYMKVPEPPKPKKEYLTEKKLKEKLDQADIDLEDLKKQYNSLDPNKTDDLIKMDALKVRIDEIEVQKIEWQHKLDKKLAAKEIKNLSKEQNVLQKELNAFNDELFKKPIKTYSGIWKDDITTADYADKMGSIEAKKKYFEGKILYATDTAEMNKWKVYIDQLEEFKKEGAEYYAIQQKIKKANAAIQQNKAKIAALKSGGTVKKATPFDPDAYGQRKQDAWNNRFTSKQAADQYYRPLLDAEWNNYSDVEKFGVWQYTHNSHPMNRPLSGYDTRWDRSKFKGLGNIAWDNENGNYDAVLSSKNFKNKFANAKNPIYGGDIRSYTDVIGELTTAIEKSTMKDDVWLVRGSGIEGFAGLFESSSISYAQVESLAKAGDINTLKNLLIGEVGQNHAFTSTGIAHGTGFGGNVKYNIYAPKGTKGVYAEPQSYFGHTISGEELYTAGKNYSGVGGEAEVILQRGTKYRITDIQYSGGTYEVTMEVVDQPDYFQTGFEHTWTNGTTSER